MRDSRAYRRELEVLTTRRHRVAFWVAFALTGVFVVLELRFFPQRLPYLLAWLAASIVPLVIVFSLRRFLLRRLLVTWATAAAVASTLLGLVGYALAVRADASIIGAQVVVALLVAAVLFPWPAVCQLVASMPSLLAFAGLLWTNPPAGPPLYLLAVVATAVVASFVVAQHLDVQRRAIFRESRARDEAMVVTRSLLKVARELGSAVHSHEVLERIVLRTRSLMQVDWCVLLLCGEGTKVFRIAAGSALRSDLLQEAMGLEFRLDDYPTLQGLSDPSSVLEVSRRNPPDARWRAIMRYFRTRSMLIAPIERNENVIGLLAIGRGVNDDPFPFRHHRILQGIAKQANIALENARLFADLEKANRLKSEFVATMSHELRTPLNIVIGYADLLAEGAFGVMPHEAAESVERIRQQSRELLQLIDATLDVNRLESDKAVLDITEDRLANFLDGLTEQLVRLPRSDNVNFIVRVQNDGLLCTDLGKVAVILRNLVSNAFKFTPSGEVRLEADRSSNGWARFVVEDTGVGIPEAEQARVFDMFYQVARPGELPRGVGLGLYIVRRFVSLLGGSVSVYSEEMRGTKFIVEIPADWRRYETSPAVAVGGHSLAGDH